MPNNDNQKKPSSLPEGLSSIADDEAITEINLTDFLEESSKASPLFEGFHEDIEKTEKSIENELQSLYDDIMSSGPETIVPKPMSVLTANEAEPAKIALSDPEIIEEPENIALESLWMNPEEYFDDEIPVVSLDEAEDESEEEEIQDIFEEELPEEATFEPAAVDELAEMQGDESARSDIFNMIDLLKSESDSETGFADILSEIEANAEIMPVEEELSSAAKLVSEAHGYAEPEEELYDDEYEEIDFSNDENFWDELEFTDEELAEELPAPAPVEEIVEDTVDDIEAEINEPVTIPELSEELPIPDFEEEVPVPEFEEDIIVPTPIPDSVPANFSIEISDETEESDEIEFNLEPEEALGEEKEDGFIINIPDDGNDYEKAAFTSDKLYEATPMNSKPFETEEEFEASLVVEEEPDNGGKKKKGGAGDIIRKIVLSISIITIIVSCGILVNTYFIEPYRFKADSDVLIEQMSANNDAHDESAVVDDQMKNENPETVFPEGMLAKYGQLYAQNNDFAGWVTIEGFGINLPIAQGDDNSYYLKRDIYKKYTSYGVPFFDYRMKDLKNLHRNTMVYGHNMRHDDYIFGMLENYRTKEGFAQAPVIECNTIYGDHTWFVYGVFLTNSDPKDDNGYFFPYNFIDVSTEKFAEYIKEVDKRKLYTTGVDINENDKILTLQACVYDFDGAMIVVVAREKREGESISVDTSKAYDNPNPKYPQKWYDVNKKSNSYAEDTRW